MGVVCCLTALVTLVPSTAASAHGGPHHRGSHVKVLLEGLSSPKGLAVDLDGNPVVAQGAFGPPGPVLVYPLSGPDRGTPIAVTDPVNLIDVAVSPLDGTGWGIGPAEPTTGPMVPEAPEPEAEPPHVLLFHQLADGTIVVVLDITAYQAGDPDPVDQDDFPTESNPYGLTVMPNGDALVADAAGNDVILVTPAGHASTLATFDLELVKTDHLPADFGPLPPAITAEAVPTTVTVGPDGAVYVGELKGFPFRPGTSHVWRIDPSASGVVCSVRTPQPGCTVYRAGLTAIQDIAFGRGGRLYVYELAAAGVLAFEAGLETGDFPPAVLLELRHHRTTELAAGQLSQPGGVAVGRGGKVFVTDGVFSDGRLIWVR
jgi:hypothetical protein